jgi:hypothetical protein
VRLTHVVGCRLIRSSARPRNEATECAARSECLRRAPSALPRFVRLVSSERKLLQRPHLSSCRYCFAQTTVRRPAVTAGPGKVRCGGLATGAGLLGDCCKHAVGRFAQACSRVAMKKTCHCCNIAPSASCRKHLPQGCTLPQGCNRRQKSSGVSSVITIEYMVWRLCFFGGARANC